MGGRVCHAYFIILKAWSSYKLNMAAATAGKEELLQSVFEAVCASGLVIKRQQRDEPDLNKKEKFVLLRELLESSPGCFLMRFGSALNENHLQYFDDYNDYEVTYRLKEFRKDQSPDYRKGIIRNRRYRAIEVLTETTDYFTEVVMKERCPSLYQHYIGQYLSDQEKRRLGEGQDQLSLLAQVLEGETDTDGGEGEKLSENPLEAIQEKLLYRKEFLRLMHLRFLDGKDDQDFDYSTVDGNIEYDDSAIKNRDFEDEYFDSEEPSELTGKVYRSPDTDR